jgi:hypothetical protein
MTLLSKHMPELWAVHQVDGFIVLSYFQLVSHRQNGLYLNEIGINDFSKKLGIITAVFLPYTRKN